MKIKRILLTFLVLFFTLVNIKCTTEDILPALSITSSSPNLSEANGTVEVTATLNGPATSTLNIPFELGGNAQNNIDYQLSSSDFVIQKGATTGKIIITSIQDNLIEGTETIIISIKNNSNVLISSPISVTINLQDDDTDTDNDGIPDALDNCPTIPGEVSNNGCPYMGFIINEVLYDPADGIAGDANGDGTRDPLQDEFIEFFNSTANSIDISGYTISDASQIRHTFPAGTIVPSNKAIVVFGGGNISIGNFGGSMVQTASSGQLNMNNGADFITIRNASNTIILTFDINVLSGNPNEAYTRNPDIYSTTFERYSNIPSSGTVIHTPGKKVNGSNF
jgi:Lamin Tail Domain/Thrombospondin type 3 repeat